MKEKIYYVIQLKSGLFFKVNNSTGGYPTDVDDFEFCEKYKQNIVLIVVKRYNGK